MKDNVDIDFKCPLLASWWPEVAGLCVMLIWCVAGMLGGMNSEAEKRRNRGKNGRVMEDGKEGREE